MQIRSRDSVRPENAGKLSTKNGNTFDDSLTLLVSDMYKGQN